MGVVSVWDYQSFDASLSVRLLVAVLLPSALPSPRPPLSPSALEGSNCDCSTYTPLIVTYLGAWGTGREEGAGAEERRARSGGLRRRVRLGSGSLLPGRC